MYSIQKNFFIISTLVVALLWIAPVEAMTADANSDYLTCDVDFEFCENPAITEIINQTNWDITRICDKEVVVGLLESIGLLPLLEQNFFLKSNNLNSRSLLDYPEFIPFRHDADKRGFVMSFFFNQTTRGFFTKDSTNICNYLVIGQPEFLAVVNTILTRLEDLDFLDGNKALILDLLDLFAPFTVQERRMGMMMCAKQKFGHWHASIQLPWYYLERNHFVNLELQKEIEDTIAQITGIPVSEINEQEQLRFQEAHFISDKLGLGDMRIMIDHPVLKRSYWTMRVGGLATIPTAFSMEHGIKGSKFCRLSNRPLLDLCSIIDGFHGTNAITRLMGQRKTTAYFLGALDNASAMLLDSPLGNNGHLELGLYMKNKFPISMYIQQPWAHRLIWRSFTAIQYQLPAWETRSFIVPVDVQGFNDLSFDFSQGTEGENARLVNATYNFITEQLTDRLFPIGLHAKVHPGWIFRMTSNICYEAPKGGFAIGSDTWIRSSEKITDVQCCPFISKAVDICNAQAPFAYQAKIYGAVFGKVIKPEHIWAIGMSADYTYWSKGIGQDFTLAFNVDVTF